MLNRQTANVKRYVKIERILAAAFNAQDLVRHTRLVESADDINLDVALPGSDKKLDLVLSTVQGPDAVGLNVFKVDQNVLRFHGLSLLSL